MARVLRAIGNQTYVIVPVLVPAKIHPGKHMLGSAGTSGLYLNRDSHLSCMLL